MGFVVDGVYTVCGCLVIPEGELRAAMIPNAFTETAMHEVFAHPFTAGELVTQSRLGLLRVNGVAATAEVVDRLGNGEFIVRITQTESRPRLAELQDWTVAA